MVIDFKDIFTISLATASLFISLYQLWDSRRKKLKIYFGTNIRDQDDILMHFITLSLFQLLIKAIDHCMFLIRDSTFIPKIKIKLGLIC